MSKKSKKRQQANQQNAQKSTGPVTEEGKAVSSRNAMTHGLFSTQVVLETESEADYQRFYNAMMAELKPVGEHENHFAERYINDMWRSKRGYAYHTAIETEVKDIRERVRLFDQYTRAMARIDSRMFRARQELRSLQAARLERESHPSHTRQAMPKPPAYSASPPPKEDPMGSFCTPPKKPRPKYRNLQQSLLALGQKYTPGSA